MINQNPVSSLIVIGPRNFHRQCGPPGPPATPLYYYLRFSCSSGCTLSPRRVAKCHRWTSILDINTLHTTLPSCTRWRGPTRKLCLSTFSLPKIPSDKASQSSQGGRVVSSFVLHVDSGRGCFDAGIYHALLHPLF
jgi:hypothetical protein